MPLSLDVMVEINPVITLSVTVGGSALCMAKEVSVV